MQVGDHDKYLIRVDGSRRLTLRNRSFLRKMCPSNATSSEAPQWPPVPSPQTPRVQSPIAQPEIQNMVVPSSPMSGKVQVQPELGAPVVSPVRPVVQVQPELAAPAVSPAVVHSTQLPTAEHQSPSVQSLLQPSRQPDKRAPGRPRKKTNFNFSPATTVPQSVQPQQLALSPDAHELSPAGSHGLPSPRRSTRETKKPEWYGYRE